MQIYIAKKSLKVYKDEPYRIMEQVNQELREKIENGRLTIEENG